MRLYHYSENKFSVLTPQIGNRRHTSEHYVAIAKAGVWLTEDSENPPYIGGWQPRFKHVVEVDESDPRLSLDTSVTSLEKDWIREIGVLPQGFNNPKRYFYEGDLTVVDVHDLSHSETQMV